MLLWPWLFWGPASRFPFKPGSFQGVFINYTGAWCPAALYNK